MPPSPGVVDPIRWLFQPVYMPFVAYIITLLLPAGYLAKASRRILEERLPVKRGQ